MNLLTQGENKMRILIPGIDGYLGWPLALHLTARGYQVAGCDFFLRRKWVEEMGSWSAIPIVSMSERLAAFREKFGKNLPFYEGDLTDFDFVSGVFEDFQPEAVVHLGECPSAPYSMKDTKNAIWVQKNNIIGSLNILGAMKEHSPEAHLVKLGTMGEYGTPNIAIPEGFFTVDYRGRTDTLPFPRQAGSWYHWSKVHDSNNVMFACRVWGLQSTDIMQGVVFGTGTDQMDEDPRLNTRLDFDQCFGTAINRFACQAVVGHPLTPYGRGGQQRGFLPLKDSMQCLTLALENPPERGEYRVFNQFEETYSINELAGIVQTVGNKLGLDVEVRSLENPRQEAEEHFFAPDHQHLLDLGYQPTRDLAGEVEKMIGDLLVHRDRINQKRDALLPDIRWDGSKRKSAYFEPTPIPLKGDL